MTRRFSFETWDVFTDQAFGGNPLAVITDGRGLNTVDMQRIAREFNFSETTVVLPAQTPAGTAQVRIFDPAHELPFAGHPTIGTAIALAEAGEVFGTPVGTELVLEEGVGPIACSVRKSNGLWQAEFTTEAPFEILQEIPVTTVAACLGLRTTQIRTARHLPCMASKGLPFVFVELNDAAALAAAQPETGAFRLAEAKFPNPVDFFAIAPYIRHANHVDMRMFAPLSGVPEDPATGSAAAALGALQCHLDNAPVRLTISQGVQMGRPSALKVQAQAPTKDRSIVQVAGNAVRTMQGSIELP